MENEEEDVRICLTCSQSAKLSLSGFIYSYIFLLFTTCISNFAAMDVTDNEARTDWRTALIIWVNWGEETEEESFVGFVFLFCFFILN